MKRKVRCADLLVEALTCAGVERIFTVSGNHIMSLFDACNDSRIELVHVRHEAAAVHMADAWGRLTCSPGVALVTGGPGLANTLSALFVALSAESPVVLISGRAPETQIGRGAFQELAQAELATYVTKASCDIVAAESIAKEISQAFRTACSGRPGPVHLGVPVDTLESTVSMPPTSPVTDDFRPPTTVPVREYVSQAAEALRAAKRPLLLGGPHVTRGATGVLLRAFADNTGIPGIAMESPRGVNDPAQGALAEILRQADVVALVGKRTDFTLQFGEALSETASLIQFDPDLAVLQTTANQPGLADRLLVRHACDSAKILEQLYNVLCCRSADGSPWTQTVTAALARRCRRRFRSDESSAEGPEGTLAPWNVCRSVHEFLQDADESVFISDGGEFGQWAQADIMTDHRLINGPSGSIGSAIPFALAARMRFPAARIVTVSGDGAFGFHALEFDTAVRYDLPFVAVVGNDACWNAEYQIQLRQYSARRAIGCELNRTRYDHLVHAIGGHGEFVTQPDELGPALRRAHTSGKPACVNVLIDRAAAPTV